MNDPTLVERLKDKVPSFNAPALKKLPIITLLLSYLLPILPYLWAWGSFDEEHGKADGRQCHDLRQKQRKKSTSPPRLARPLPTWPARMRPKNPYRRLWTSSTTLPNTPPSAPPCRKGPCWWALPAPARPCWPKRWLGKPRFPSFPSPARNLWRCLWVWAQPKSGTCLNRPRKSPLHRVHRRDRHHRQKRDNGGIGGNDEREQTLNQLLTGMDGFDGKRELSSLAATNQPDTLDKALLR